jgi:hypothetical protein
MAHQRIFSLSADGYFLRGGKRFVPVGANYWPGSCGVEMWPAWPEDELRRDLDTLAKHGLNCVRFFLRWQDFEPAAGHYDETMFARLAQYMRWCGERGVLAHPSLFVGFMSGGIFWPKWREERNVFSDSFMVERAAAFAHKAATVLAPLRAHVLALDQGNELCCLSDSWQARPSAVRNWCATVNAAVRRAWPEVLIVSGNEQNQLLGDSGWRFGQQPGTDFYSMHGYPVPNWHSLPFDGMTDPLCQSLLPFYTRIARSFGPVMLQEFGTILTRGREQQEQYLRALLPACWDAGANGFLWWCLRDITAKVHPYLRCGFEGYLGLVDAQDRVKPGLEFFFQFAREVQTRPAPKAVPGAIGIYFPQHYYTREEQANPGNEPRTLSRWLCSANFLLRQLGHETRVVRGDGPLDPALGVLLIPGAIPASDEAERLAAWVAAGGQLIWHGPAGTCWGPEYTRLLGARPVDYRAPRAAKVEAFGRTWTFTRHPQNARLEIALESARVTAKDDLGLPVLLEHALGKGRVVYALPLVEDEFAAVSNDREARAVWTKWYEGALKAAGA